MPPGRTAPAYTPPEEEILPPPSVAGGYSSYLPPADAAPPPLPVEGAAPPPPAPSYATEPYGGNDTISPVPESQGYGTAYYTSAPAPYQGPAPMLQSPSPQVNPSQFGQMPSEYNDPLLSGRTTPYQVPAQQAPPVGGAPQQPISGRPLYSTGDRQNSLSDLPPSRAAGGALTPPAGSSNLLADYYNGAASHARSMKVAPKPKKWTKGDYEIAGRMLLGMGGGMMGRGAPNGIQGPYGAGVANTPGMGVPAPTDDAMARDMLFNMGQNTLGPTNSQFDAYRGGASDIRHLGAQTPRPADQWMQPTEFGWNPGQVPSASEQYDNGSSMTMADTISQPAYIPEHPNQGPLAANSALGYGPLPEKGGLDTSGWSLPVPTGKGKGGYFDTVGQGNGTVDRSPKTVRGGGTVDGAWRPNIWDGLGTPQPARNTATPSSTSVTNINNVPRDFSPGSREGYGAANQGLREGGMIDARGNLTSEGLADLAKNGMIDANGLWTPAAAQINMVPQEAVGQPGNAIWLRDPATWTVGSAQQPASPPASDAGQPLDPNAVLPVTPAEVAAVEGTGNYGGGGGYSSGGGRSRSSGGGGYSGGGYSRGGGYSSRSRRGGSSYGSDDSGDDWESFLRDFDGDGDVDEKDQVRAQKMAAKRKKTRRGKRGGRTTVGYQTTPMREEILGTIEKSRNKSKEKD